MYSCGDIFKHCHISTCGEEELEKKLITTIGNNEPIDISSIYLHTTIEKKLRKRSLLAGSRPSLPFLNRLGRLSPLSSECESGSKKRSSFYVCASFPTFL